MSDDIDPRVPPSGTGCLECDQTGSWWVHLRRCAKCGHVGCCDDSLNKHATAHWHESGHPVMQSFEPGEDWFWDYRTERTTRGPELAPPHSHPASQTVPGPAERVPADWQRELEG
ncbi:UBP-type zinc finger domain-containing protein [Microbacterium sp.]|uniref:UBP-type zinc finger domain-containing protein n=1 Tax=Microbacterium sp. TaxID=51671 RepID=UPI003F726ED0